MTEKQERGKVNCLFSEKITEIFDFLFWDDEDPVIIFESSKGIVKMNSVAKQIFANVNENELEEKMDKTSLLKWRKFLTEATSSSLASCELYVTIPPTGICKFEVEGGYNHSTQQHVIRFKQAHHETTLRKHVLEGLTKYEYLFNNVPYGMVMTTVNGVILEANKKVEAFFDVDSHSLKGKSANLLFELIPESKYNSKPFFKILENKGSAEMMLSRVDRNGEAKFYQFISTYNKSLDMYLTVIRDDTEKILLKKQIDHSRSLSTLGQLAASIAHEIRNPMTSLKGFTQLLSQQVTDEGKQYLEIITSELNRMESILNEFLVLSKPVERSFRFISLSSIIKQVVDFMHPQGIIQNIELDFFTKNKDSDCILGDAYELKKVFMNIFKNAFEVMPNGGTVTITQSLIENNQVRVSVKDEGGGMPPEQIHKIFLPFYTSKEEGTGLGLAHAVQTIEDHGGCIEVESEIGKGTTFHLMLPIYRLDEEKEKIINDTSYAESNR